MRPHRSSVWEVHQEECLGLVIVQQAAPVPVPQVWRRRSNR